MPSTPRAFGNDNNGIITTSEYGTTSIVDPSSTSADSCIQGPGNDDGVVLDLGGELLAFRWGAPRDAGTAGFWVDQARRGPMESRLGRTLREEIAACIIGGYGMRADLAVLAFKAVRDAGFLHSGASTEQIEAVLRGPHFIGDRDRPLSYRFARQRAARLSATLDILATAFPPQDAPSLRSWLLDLPGVGPKTAAWIVRNHLDAPVAIVDVHVQRAGLAAGFFSERWRVAHDYDLFEDAFLQIASLGGVSPSQLDARMWFTLSRLGRRSNLVLDAGRKLSAFPGVAPES